MVRGRPSFRALLLPAILVLAACGGDTPEGPNGPSGGDSAGRAACQRFREVQFETSEAAIAAGLREVGDLAAESTTPSIRDNGVRVGEEANARFIISGDADPAIDALAEACNAEFPI